MKISTVAERAKAERRVTLNLTSFCGVFPILPSSQPELLSNGKQKTWQRRHFKEIDWPCDLYKFVPTSQRAGPSKTGFRQYRKAQEAASPKLLFSEILNQWRDAPLTWLQLQPAPDRFMTGSISVHLMGSFDLILLWISAASRSRCRDASSLLRSHEASTESQRRPIICSQTSVFDGHACIRWVLGRIETLSFVFPDGRSI